MKLLKQLQKNPSGVAEHHLFHALSGQEIANLDEWHRIFKASQYKLQEEIRFDPAEQGYFILKNNLV